MESELQIYFLGQVKRWWVLDWHQDHRNMKFCSLGSLFDVFAIIRWISYHPKQGGKYLIHLLFVFEKNKIIINYRINKIKLVFYKSISTSNLYRGNNILCKIGINDFPLLLTFLSFDRHIRNILYPRSS